MTNSVSICVRTTIVLALCLVAVPVGLLWAQAGLLAYYTFDEQSYANDVSTNHRHGEANGVTFTADRFGKTNGAYYFNGVNSYVRVGNFAPTTNAVTYAIWVKPEPSNKLMNIISKHSSNTNIAALLRVKPDNRYSFEWTLGGRYHDFSCYGCSSNPTSGITPVSNTGFDYIVFTYDGAKVILYKNAVQVYALAVSGAIVSNGNRLAFGAKSANFGLANEYFKGVIDDVKIYGRALSALEVMQSYQREKPLSVYSCRLQDSLQLVSLYQATNGNGWTRKWNFAKPINTWHGITLNSTGCVSAIDLSMNGLAGALPAYVSFSGLLSLNLASNQITGSIPLLNLPSLDYLNLNYNKLSGNIPDFYLPSLTKLYLNNNQLTGCIPMGIKANCPKIGPSNASVANNANLITQDWAVYWSNPLAACSNAPFRFGTITAEAPFALWPNPADNQLTVAIDASEDGAYELKFVNLLGQTIMQETLQLRQGYLRKEIDVSRYTKGIYTAILTHGDKPLTQKFVVSH